MASSLTFLFLFFRLLRNLRGSQSPRILRHQPHEDPTAFLEPQPFSIEIIGMHLHTWLTTYEQQIEDSCEAQ